MDKYQRFHTYASNRIKDLEADPEKSSKKNEGLEAAIICLQEDLEASSKKSEEPLQLNENGELGAKIWSVIELLQEDLEE